MHYIYSDKAIKTAVRIFVEERFKDWEYKLSERFDSDVDIAFDADKQVEI